MKTYILRFGFGDPKRTSQASAYHANIRRQRRSYNCSTSNNRGASGSGIYKFSYGTKLYQLVFSGDRATALSQALKVDMLLVALILTIAAMNMEQH